MSSFSLICVEDRANMRTYHDDLELCVFRVSRTLFVMNLDIKYNLGEPWMFFFQINFPKHINVVNQISDINTMTIHELLSRLDASPVILQ